jgi:hypothetical protein
MSIQSDIVPHYSAWASCWYYHMNQSMAGPALSQTEMKKHVLKICPFLINYFSYFSDVRFNAWHTTALYLTYSTYRAPNRCCHIQTSNAELYGIVDKVKNPIAYGHIFCKFFSPMFPKRHWARCTLCSSTSTTYATLYHHTLEWIIALLVFIT